MNKQPRSQALAPLPTLSLGLGLTLVAAGHVTTRDTEFSTGLDQVLD